MSSDEFVNPLSYCVENISHIASLLMRPNHNLVISGMELDRLAAIDFMEQKTIHPLRKCKNLAYVKYCACFLEEEGLIVTAYTDKGASKREKIERMMKANIIPFNDKLNKLVKDAGFHSTPFFEKDDNGNIANMMLIIHDKKYAKKIVPAEYLYRTFSFLVMQEWDFHGVDMQYENLCLTESHGSMVC